MLLCPNTLFRLPLKVRAVSGGGGGVVLKKKNNWQPSKLCAVGKFTELQKTKQYSRKKHLAGLKKGYSFRLFSLSHTHFVMMCLQNGISFCTNELHVKNKSKTKEKMLKISG